MEATYLGDIELTDETLEHYGVKGMKWRHRKGTTTSAMKNDPRYSKYYMVTPGAERERLNRLNPGGTRVKTTAKKAATTSTSTTTSSSTSKSKKGSGSSKKAVKDILSKIKLTKGGKSSSAEKKTKEKAAKKESSGKASSEKKTSEKKESSSSKTEEKKTTQQPQVIEKTRVSEEYTKYLERKQGKANYSKLQDETVQERIKTTDAQKKRRARGNRKIYTRS